MRNKRVVAISTTSLSQNAARQTGISKQRFNSGRLFARLNGTEGIDAVTQQRENRASDGRLSVSEGLDRARAGG